jgi:serine/threonine protein kinase
MPQPPDNDQHLAQILAGTTGRIRGHEFEENLTRDVNAFSLAALRQYGNPAIVSANFDGVKSGRPAEILLRFLISRFRIADIQKLKAYWLGGLATSGLGDRMLNRSGNQVKRSKADIVVEITTAKELLSLGISTKSCNNKKSTNPQLYLTTPSGFCDLLRRNGLQVESDAEVALKMFCGTDGYRPIDTVQLKNSRTGRTDRWFWEELPALKKAALKQLIVQNQRAIALALFKLAYVDDPYAPSVLLHQIHKPRSPDAVDVAIYQIDDLIDRSLRYKGFELRPYRYRNATHLAPRFQRFGPRQNHSQLQFNLQAGYFNKLEII